MTKDYMARTALADLGGISREMERESGFQQRERCATVVYPAFSYNNEEIATFSESIPTMV
jgi:hypothetical protein